MLAVSTLPTLPALIPSWRLSLQAANKSPRTVQSYVESADQFVAFLSTRGMPLTPDTIAREHVEAWISHLLDHWKPATAAVRFRSLQQLFKWLEDEGEIRRSPMTKMRPPKVPEEIVGVLTEDQLRRLLATCEGATLVERRDQAILRLLVDCGGRRAGIAGLGVADVNLEQRTAIIKLKGGDPLIVPFGVKTARAIDRYLRVRLRHPQAALPWLWLGKRGRFGASGIAQMVRARGEQVGITNLHPHQFRHTFAHRFLAAGGSEGDLMQLAGWKSRDMLQRYAKATAAERARESHRRLALGDSL